MSLSIFKTVSILLTIFGLICATPMSFPSTSLTSRDDPLIHTTKNLCSNQDAGSDIVHLTTSNCMVTTFQNNETPGGYAGTQTWVYVFDHACKLLGWSNGLAANQNMDTTTIVNTILPAPFQVNIGTDYSAPQNFNFWYEDYNNWAQQHVPPLCFDDCTTNGECGETCQYWFPC